MKAILLTSIAAFGLAGAAFSQDAAAPAQPPAAAPAPAAPATVSDEEVQKVAGLAADWNRLNGEAAPKIAAATDPAAKSALQKELDAAVQASVTKHGISLERYNDIARAAQADKALAARITAANRAATGTATPSSATEPARQ